LDRQAILPAFRYRIVSTQLRSVNAITLQLLREMRG
jgi:hypothetical protein